MIRRSLAFLLIGCVVVIAGDAQTPAPGAKGETKSFSFFFDGDGGYLGIQTEEVNNTNLSKYGLREVRGVAIEKVVEGSPADKAGLQDGDVIVRLNNEEITSVRKLTRMLGEISPDHQVRLTVVRSGAERDITATLGKRPTPRFENGAFSMNLPRSPLPPSAEFPRLPRVERMPRGESLPGAPDQPLVWRMGSGRRIGVGVTTLTKQLGEHFGVASGVMINEVRADSPAAKAGLKAGDIIVEADGREVKNEGDLILAIAEKKEGDVTLTFVRDGNRQTITVTPEEAKDGFNTFFEFRGMPDASMMAPLQFKSAVPMAPMGTFQFLKCIL
jgi:membrane-associated protease RseP (regulator of RpoE activity)